MRWLGWYLLNRLFRLLELGYCRLFRLRPISPLLYIQHRRYDGPVRQLDAQTWLEPGDPMAVLHFNNSELRRAQQRRKGAHGGFVFARLLLQAMQSLAEQVEQDPQLQAVAGFHGVTWIPPHGHKLGFEAEPLPDTCRTRLLGLHFRLLLYAFNPETARRRRDQIWPHAFWLSRNQLLEKFGQGRGPR